MTEWRLHHYSGCGNRFLITYDPDSIFPTDKETISGLCDQPYLQVDGLIVARPSTTATIRMLYYNRDGSRGSMCGNGLRCLSHYTASNIFPNMKYLLIETDVGTRQATVEEESIEVAMGKGLPPKPWTLSIQQKTISGSFVEVGVPHAVITLPSVENIDVLILGRSIRYHPYFGEVGTNVNFTAISKTTADLTMRTYERGVERETQACGTGAVATAISMWHHFPEKNQLTLKCHSGEILTVRKEREDHIDWYFLKGNVLCLGIVDAVTH